MRVLYVQDTGLVSGSEHSLLEFLRRSRPGIDPLVLCPAGPFRERVRRLDIPTIEIPEIDLSFRPSPHSVPAAVRMARAATLVRRTSQRLKLDVVHANSVRAGLVSIVAAKAGGLAPVVHVRDFLPDTRAGRMVRRVIMAGAPAVIADSAAVAADFAGDRNEKLHVIYDLVDVERYDPSRVDRREARAALGLTDSDQVLGVIAQITPWKRQDHAIRVLAALTERCPSTRLLLAGEPKFVRPTTRFNNLSYLDSLRRLAAELGVSARVDFLGERTDVEVVMATLDVLLLPTAREPLGLALLEGMAMERVVVASDAGGPAEVVVAGRSGLLLPPDNIDAWAAAVAELLGHPDRSARMGVEARRRILTRFDPAQEVESQMRIYQRALAAGQGRS